MSIFEPIEKLADEFKESDKQALRVGAATVKSSFKGAFWGGVIATFCPPLAIPVVIAVSSANLHKELKKEGLID